MLTVRALSNLIEAELKALGIQESECLAETRLILEHVSRLSLVERLKDPERLLDDEVVHLARAILARRKKREPLQYCLGETHFYGLAFQVRPGVLIPRADSETLVESALHYLRRLKRAVRIGEIGMGSGIISISLLKHLQEAFACGCDISADAVELSRANAEKHGVSDRLQLCCADWHDWLDLQICLFDCIVANPPYIPFSQKESLSPEVRLYEPAQALFAGEDGLEFYREFAGLDKYPLSPDAVVFLEIGLGQERAIERIFCQTGWQMLGTHRDLNGTVRVLSLVPPGRLF